jgi:hypothetical protein
VAGPRPTAARAHRRRPNDQRHLGRAARRGRRTPLPADRGHGGRHRPTARPAWSAARGPAQGRPSRVGHRDERRAAGGPRAAPGRRLGRDRQPLRAPGRRDARATRDQRRAGAADRPRRFGRGGARRVGLGGRVGRPGTPEPGPGGPAGEARLPST